MNQLSEKIIDGKLFERLVLSGANSLKTHVKIVNDLNVFPIPDGDTGDNMLMTLSGGLNGLKSVKENSVDLKASALASGMLLNARGNSGVILSQLFAGLAEGLKGCETADMSVFGNALKLGVKRAYSAVIKPVEGTMLTVAREAADGVEKTTKENLGEFFSTFTKSMQESLERTPDILAVLKEAGVIDSGGAGLLYIAEGMKHALDSEDVFSEIAVTTDGPKDLDFSKFTADSEMVFGYCTECLLRLQNKKVDAENFDTSVIIDFLESIGDSIVCFKTDTIVKIHVHTMTPYKVLEFCQRFGEFLTIKIENMTLEHNEKDQEEDIVIKMPEKTSVRKKIGIVTVANGKGLTDTFSELGADFVIDGGQGNNPSIETFIGAFDKVNADEIFVLPNNGNIIMAARQAADMYEKSNVRVIETKNLGQAYSILSMIDFGCDDADRIEERMKEDMQEVVTGMISTAVRSTVVDGVDIEKGNYIGFIDKKMLFSHADKIKTLEGLLDKIGMEEKSFVIAVYGNGITNEERKETAKLIESSYPDVEFYEIDGQQDVYDFILIIE